jgi:hypothetical protein
MCLKTSSRDGRLMSSKAVTRSPTGAQAAEQLDRRGRRRHRQPGGDDGARRAKSLRVAAVTMPRVPSAPMKSCLRS